MRLSQIALATLLSVSLALPAFAQPAPATPPATTPPATTTAPARPATAAPATAAPATTRPAPAVKPATAPVSINTASTAELDKLKGIGPARAKKIIEGRPYKAIDELDSKKIIPHSVYEGIKAQSTL